MLDIAMLVAEELIADGLTLAQIWSFITHWIENRIYPGNNHRDRQARRLEQGEHTQ
jgi:hypothetical protein